jgi:hypothetical protein
VIAIENVRLFNDLKNHGAADGDERDSRCYSRFADGRSAGVGRSGTERRHDYAMQTTRSFTGSMVTFYGMQPITGRFREPQTQRRLL